MFFEFCNQYLIQNKDFKIDFSKFHLLEQTQKFFLSMLHDIADDEEKNVISSIDCYSELILNEYISLNKESHRNDKNMTMTELSLLLNKENLSTLINQEDPFFDNIDRKIL